MPSLKRRADNTDDSASRKRHNTRRTATAEPEQQPEESNPMEVPIRSGSVSKPVAVETAPTNDEHVKTLKLLHDDFDVLRQTLTCRICERLFYEPYVLHCGHTYCYRCLSTWFNSNAKMSCPNCRVRITQIPAPSYAIKDMVMVFMKRAELLPDGETVQEHETWRKEEEEHLAADKNNTDPRVGGLFKGRFNGRRGVLRPLVDPSDNVARCPSCHWELEDDSCPNCGRHFDSEGFESGSDDYDSLDDPDDMDGDIDAADDDGSAWGWGADLDRMDGIGGHSDASNSDYGGDAAFQMDMRGYNVREQVQNAMQNQANARRLYAAMHNPNHHRPHAFHNNGWPIVPAGVRNLNHEDDHDEQEDEEEDDEEDSGSMDGFVVNDNESEVAASHQSISSDDDGTERSRVGARRRIPLEDESETHFPWATAPSRRSRRVVESSDDSSGDSNGSDSNSEDSSDSDSTPGNSQRNPEVLGGSSSDSESDSVESERYYQGQPHQHMSSSTADDSDDEPPRPAVSTRRMNQAQSQRRRQPQFQSAGRLNPRTNVARSGRQRNDQGVINLASP
ncbi:hypothetical protein KVT40_009125 [Elsinoe batatas]|uniref:RING-type domain-containing protein n=1 Tax=Elsinoe batatas TaxID=2601811 RepID=A0A8K0PG24_9PEZI|nr:hypothetical protein KVT40_009125 [Elsinoe batatas]